jgi:hypothetical protein
MTLPPFPFVPASPEERLRLTQYGELCARMYKDDAERYRWLRDEENGDSEICPLLAGEALDAAIDAARSGSD